MAVILPLVVKNGQIQQAQAIDTLGIGITEVDVISLQNNGTSAVGMGRVVCASGSNSFALAQANASATKNVVGLVRDTNIAAGASGSIQTDGILTAGTTTWDAVIGNNSGGLTPGSIYYLSPTTAGAITPNAPTTAGQYVVQIGIALSSTSLDIRDSGFDILL